MQAQNSTIQGGMIGNFISIYQQEGTRGLWKVSSGGAPVGLLEFNVSVSIILFLPRGVREEE